MLLMSSEDRPLSYFEDIIESCKMGAVVIVFVYGKNSPAASCKSEMMTLKGPLRLSLFTLGKERNLSEIRSW